MGTDVVALLREFGFSIAEGHTDASWVLVSTEASHFEVALTTPVSRLNAHSVRNHIVPSGETPRPLFIGHSATPGVIRQAQEGRIDILTETPTRLIYRGQVHELLEGERSSKQKRYIQRPAWTRWAVERYLLLSHSPARQSEIAAALQTSQQSVSNAARHLGKLVIDHGDGLMAADRSGLLAHWVNEYSGAGGQEFGWYSLDSIAAQTAAATEVADFLDFSPLVSSDVAADHLAPWKLPIKSRIYVKGPIDLGGDGFVPASLEEATLVTCVLADPSLWMLAALHPADVGLPLADPALVYWDLINDDALDNAEAADHLAARIIEGAQ